MYEIFYELKLYRSLIFLNNYTGSEKKYSSLFKSELLTILEIINVYFKGT